MISVIIPALNEARGLPACLDTLLQQQGEFEVLLADGNSEDGTAEVAGRYPGVRVLTAPRGRALQMNAGAAAAAGELLLFLHADTQLPPGAISRLNALEQDPDFQAGGFLHRFSGTQWPLRFVSWLHNQRCRLTGVFYGDQAMVVRRSMFKLAGGFPEQPILEDVLLSEKLLQLTRPRLLDPPVVTDSRKFERMGPWISLWRCLLILTCYELRLPIRGRAFFTPVR